MEERVKNNKLQDSRSTIHAYNSKCFLLPEFKKVSFFLEQPLWPSS